MTSEELSLRWNNYQNHLATAFETLLRDNELVDVTLGVEGRRLPAHKVLLSACSPYFRDLLQENRCQHPIIVLRDVTFSHMTSLLQFMYNGEVRVEKEQLSDLLKTAVSLQIQGLTDQEGGLAVALQGETSHEGSQSANNINKGKEAPRLEKTDKMEHCRPQVKRKRSAEHLDQRKVVQSAKSPVVPSASSPSVSSPPFEAQNVVDVKTVIGDNNVKQEVLDIVEEAENVMNESYDQVQFNCLTQGAEPVQVNNENLVRSSVKLRNDLLAPRDPLAKAKERGYLPCHIPELMGPKVLAQQQAAMVNNKPCVCIMCGARFCYRNQLTEHKKTAHHLDN